MAVTIGSVTEGNANAEEIKNNSPDSELYENNKKYLQGSLVKFNDKIYLAKRNVPSDVDLDNPYYWEIFMDAADSKRVDELFEKTGNLDELETESKDNLVAAINEVAECQADYEQNDETKPDFIKGRTHWIEENIEELQLIDKILTNFFNSFWNLTQDAELELDKLEEVMTILNEKKSEIVITNNENI